MMIRSQELVVPQQRGLRPVWGRQRNQMVTVCREFVTRAYKDAEYIDDGLIENGVMVETIDPYVNDSLYFYIPKNMQPRNELAGMARQIYMPDNVRPNEWHFPIEEFELHPEERALINYLKTEEPASMVEISQLACPRSPRALLNLYKMMWQHSKKEGHKVWLIAADEHFSLSLSFFGSAVINAGLSREHIGSTTEPMILFPDLCPESMVERYLWIKKYETEQKAESYKRKLDFLRSGLPKEYLGLGEIKAFESMGFIIDD